MPYTEDEIKEIMETDRSEGRVWSPPPLASPSLNDLIGEIGRALDLEYTVVSNEVNLFAENQPAKVDQTSTVVPREDV